MNYLSKLIKHIRTVSQHRKLVRRYCFKVGLYKQGLLHDISKYSITELLISAKYYTGNKSPVYFENKEKGYSLIERHHLKLNKHHVEYWYNKGMEIPYNFFIEMVMDIISAGKIYNKNNFTKQIPVKFVYNSKIYKKLSFERYQELIELLTLYSAVEEDTFIKVVKNRLIKNKES